MIRFFVGMIVGVVLGAGGLICISACKASKFDIFDDDQAAVPEDKRASKERYDDIY